MKLHYFDGMGICLNCDRCQNAECCPGSENEECDGHNWDFLTDGTTERMVAEFMQRREAEGE